MTLKTPVLVVLPPSHKCADLGRVLALARKAFGNLSLSIADLNVQFESVSSQELLPIAAAVPDDDQAGTVVAQEPPQGAIQDHDPWAAPASHSSPQGQVDADDWTPSVKTAAQSAPAAAATQHVVHPTPLPSPARSAIATSSTSRRTEFDTAAAPSPAPEPAPLSGQPAPSAPAPQRQQQQPAAAAAPAALAPSGPLPDAHPAHWRLIVGNLDGNLSTDAILDTIVPRGISLTGATFHSPVPAGPGKSGPLVRYVKLAFACEADAHACHGWVKYEAEKGGVVHGMVATGTKVHVGNPIRPVPGATPPSEATPVVQAPVAVVAEPASSRGTHTPTFRPSPAPTPTPTHTPTPRQTSSAHTPELAASPLPEANPKAAYRLTIGNLLPDLTPTQLLSGLLPRGIRPLGLTLAPPQQLLGRDDSVRRVQLEFASKLDMDTVYEHVRAQDGRVAEMVAPRTKMFLSMSGVAPPIKVKAPALPASSSSFSSASVPAPRPAAASSASPAAAASASDFPEASPSAYRLHISNLVPTADVPQILAALVPPKGVTVLGVSMFSPRSLSASKRDVLVRSLKLAFATEMEAKKCVDWIKKDQAGGVARIVVKGAKVSVGNPMAPME